MNVQAVLRAQFAQTHGIIEMAVGDADDATLHYIAPGSTLGSIASIYAHAIFTEDRLLNIETRGAATIFETQGWAAKASLPWPSEKLQTPEWSASVKMDLAAFREYARAVYAATDRYIADASDEEMERLMDNPVGGGKIPVGHFLATIMVWHMACHQGEISALQGIQGHRGLPF